MVAVYLPHSMAIRNRRVLAAFLEKDFKKSDLLKVEGTPSNREVIVPSRFWLFQLYG